MTTTVRSYTPRRLQLRDEATHLAVREGDFAVVGVALVARLERFGRPIWRMRVVEMNPGEERRTLRVGDPGQCLVHDLVGGTLDAGQRNAFRLADVEVVHVCVEPLIDPPFRVQDIRGDEGARAISALLEQFGQRDLVGAEEEAAIVTNAVLGWELSGEDARVGRQRQRGDRHRLVEQHAFLREPIEDGRLDIGRTVRADPVSPRRVERNHQDVERVARHAPRERAEIDARAVSSRPRRQKPCSHQRDEGDRKPGRPGPEASPGSASGRSRALRATRR